MISSMSGVVVRSAKLRDATRLAAVCRESWHHAYAGVIPHSDLINVLARRDSLWWRSRVKAGEQVLVVEVGGTIGGCATAGPARSRGAYQGEIYELYMVPSFQGLGLGEYLFEAARYRLDQRRLPGLIVWALAANEPALDFYARRGGRQVGRNSERFGSAKLDKIALGWA
ncbi:MAG: GNAT family N-acetyltransferase [Hyphomicrobium aestuarii]|nr:GNAT family N-acetyltransferase [Hyphomicrobium aestuarii]